MVGQLFLVRREASPFSMTRQWYPIGVLTNFITRLLIADFEPSTAVEILLHEACCFVC